MQIVISPQKFTDWPALRNLMETAFAGMEGRIDPPSSLHQMTTESLAKKSRTEVMILAREGQVLLGCLFLKLDSDHGYVSKLAVHPDFQKRGIGAALIAAAISIATDRKLSRLRLSTRIELTENHTAFVKMGFLRIAGQSHPGYDRVTSVLMELRF